jgi:hypothetical protein
VARVSSDLKQQIVSVLPAKWEGRVGTKLLNQYAALGSLAFWVGLRFGAGRRLFSAAEADTTNNE